MKKVFGIFLLMLGLTSVAYAELTPDEEKEALKILEQKRKEISKEEKAAKEAAEKARVEAEKAAKEAEEARVAEEKAMLEAQEKAMKEAQETEVKVQEEQAQVQEDIKEAQAIENQPVNPDVIAADNVSEMKKEMPKEVKKPLTEAEKLEATRAKAKDKLDFYERVVRSVAREEAEIKEINNIINEEDK